ncbi:MAG: GNAT family N-acetyltransferase [Planctomycetes bacterium]|nr:GNAT family N-acetyltransferase [Planctomycetota bacterium]
MSDTSSGSGRRRAAAPPRAPSVHRNGSHKNGTLKNGPLNVGPSRVAASSRGRPRPSAAASRAASSRNGHARSRGTAAKNVHVETPYFPIEPPIEVRLARNADAAHLPRIQGLIREAHEAGAIIALRSSDYLADAIRDRRAVVVLRGGQLVGFATAHPWESGRFVSHSAMVVAPEVRGRGLSRKMKHALIELSRQRWPDAAILSLTLSPQVEQLNKSVGFEAVPYCDLTKDPEFWKGCEGCIHHPHLKRNQQQDCHCWAGLLSPPGRSRAKVIPRDAHGHPSAGSS